MRPIDSNYWLVVALNAQTLEREVVAKSVYRETAMFHKMDLEAETPRRWVGVTVEYGKRSEYESAGVPSLPKVWVN